MNMFSAIIYFSSGKRIYKELVTDVVSITIEDRKFIQITFLNVNTAFYDKMSWPAEAVSHISLKVI